MNDRKIRIFDTTLRDGQQCPGAGMSFDKNLEYADLAVQLGVDVLEAGFASASALDFEIVNTIAREFAPRPDSPIIGSLCQLREDQVDITIEALLPAQAFNKGLLHVYLPVAPDLMPASLGERANDKFKLVEDVHAAVARASKAGLEVEFSPEGYSRMGTNFDFVTDVIRAAVEAGAGIINCPDTVGGACALQGADYFVEKMKTHAAIIKTEFPERNVIWSVHCHNDFGLAVQNSINGVFDGPARQIEGCINGIGERAGNAALEQCIMILKHFGPLVDAENPFHTGIKVQYLQAICDFVGRNMLPRQPHWPVTGENAARHSAGGHTNAILKNPLIYQPFDPREIGKEISFLFGPLSGGNHAKSIIESNGYRCEDSEKVAIAQYIKTLFSERRKGVTDAELMTGYFTFRSPIKIERFDYSKSANRSAINLHGKFFDIDGELAEAHDGRDSALAALKRAIEKYFGELQIQSHRSESDTAGINANSISKIVIVDDLGQLFEGRGEDQDIEVSALKALIDAVNKAYIERSFRLATQTAKVPVGVPSTA